MAVTANLVIALGSALVNEALTSLLAAEGFGATAIEQCPPPSPPDLVLTDTPSIGTNLSALFPHAKILLLDTGVDRARLTALFVSYKTHGILSRTTDLGLLRKALKVTMAGQVWVDNETLKYFMHSHEGVIEKGKVRGITGREREIIDFVCRGLTNKEIASLLCLRQNTVKAHLNRIFRKLNTTNRSKLISLAMNNRIARPSTGTQNGPGDGTGGR